jgi:hypothetical protein
VAVVVGIDGLSAPRFDRTTILAHLEELNTELAGVGASRVELLVVGGSYLALRDLRRATRDIDTARRLGDDARRAAATIAERHQLSSQWLNDESEAFLPADFDDARADVVVEHSHLIVGVPHPDDVFVMKLNASRGEGDLADMIRLWPRCSFRSAAEAVARYATAYPREVDDPDLAEYVAEHVIARAELA